MVFHRLPPKHPRLVNCLNTEDGPWSFSDWDVTRTGDVWSLEIPLPPRTDEDKEFFDMMHENASYGSIRRITPFLPMVFQRWLSQNTTGKWCYTCIMATEGWVLDFCFQYEDDYLLFKLSF